MKATPDTPQERDEKAEVLANEVEETADQLEQEEIDRADVLAREVKRFRLETRLTLLALFIALLLK